LAHGYRLERLANIAPKHIRAYTEHMQAKGLSASTIKTDLADIRFWHDIIPNAKHKLPENASLELERRSFGKVDRTWSTPEFHRFLALCQEKDLQEYAAIACLARYAGLRIHECFRIDTAIAEDALKNMEITTKGKGGKIRTVPINESVCMELVKVLEITLRGHKLFASDGTKTHIAINRLQQFIAYHRREGQDPDSDKPMTFHGLRHAYALEQYNELIAAGYTKNEACLKVSKLLGHERADVTRIYLAGINDGSLVKQKQKIAI